MQRHLHLVVEIGSTASRTAVDNTAYQLEYSRAYPQPPVAPLGRYIAVMHLPGTCLDGSTGTSCAAQQHHVPYTRATISCAPPPGGSIRRYYPHS